MKTKVITRVTALLFIIVLCLATLVGCTPKIDIPKKDDFVTGNGGLAVQKGEYLYFVNGYTSVSDMEDGDNQGGQKYSAIYRAKLDSNNKLSYDEDGKLENCELIIDRVCGFDKTQLYIFDDRIYYATPNPDKVIDNEEAKNRFTITDFYSAKLDGSNKIRIYRTENESDNTVFEFYKLSESDSVILSIYDGTNLNFVNCSSKKVSFVSAASSVAMAKISDYSSKNNTISSQESAIYYTRSATDDEDLLSGNILAYAKLSDAKENIIAFGPKTYNVCEVNKDALLYTMKGNLDSESALHYYSTFAEDGTIDFNSSSETNKLDNVENSIAYLAQFENGVCAGLIVKNASNKLCFIDHLNDNIVVLNDEKSMTPLKVIGSKVYCYDSDNSLYVIDYKTLNSKLIYDSTKKVSDDEDADTVPSIYFSAVKNFSVVGAYAYFFIPYEGDTDTGYYLNRVNLYETELGDSLVGVLMDNYIKTETED